MNLVEIIVRVKDDAVAIGKVQAISNAFKGLGIVAAGALGVGLSTPLAAAGLALGAFAAVAMPTLDKIKTALTSTGTAGQKAFDSLTGPQKEVYTDVRKLQAGFDQLQQKMAPVVSSVADMAVKVGTALLPALGHLAKAGADILTSFFKPLLKLLDSSFFDKFIRQASQLAKDVAPALGQALVSVIKSFMKLVMDAGPAAADVLKNLLPFISKLIDGLGPVVGLVTKVADGFLRWIKEGGAVQKVVIGIGIAIGIALAAASDGWAPLVGILGALVLWLGHLWNKSETFRNIMVGVASDVAQAWTTEGIILVRTFEGLALAILDTFGTLIHAIADIPIIGDKMRGLSNAFDHAYAHVKGFSDGAVAKLKTWNNAAANAAHTFVLRGNIADLTSKLNTAERAIRNPLLSSTQRATIEANINQLMAGLRAAWAGLHAINGASATTYVNVVTQPIQGPHASAHGGITGAASGGLRNRLTMVGEHGRELLELPPGTNVHSNPDTEAMLSQGGRGGVHTIVIEWAGGPDEIWNAIKKNIRIKGGRGPNSVQVALGQP